MDHPGWEVAVVVSDTAREPIAQNVEGITLEFAILAAYAKIESGDYRHAAWQTGAVLIQRMDQTAEAKYEKWFNDFYDITRSGAKRRRFKKPQIEKDWEEMILKDSRETRQARIQSNAGRRNARDGR
jgi:hypothetical protein